MNTFLELFHSAFDFSYSISHEHFAGLLENYIIIIPFPSIKIRPLPDPADVEAAKTLAKAGLGSQVLKLLTTKNIFIFVD